MPVHSAALQRAFENSENSAASICFQAAGQIVTVLGQIERHFGKRAVASFAQQAVAEYCTKQDVQLVAVTILENANHEEQDAVPHYTEGENHYAIVIGNLADDRTRMDHLSRVMERLKYLQAVMVMLSTTDMLGTSETLGKHMGGMTAQLHKVQKLGVQLEKLNQRIEEAKRKNQPLSQKVFERHLTRLTTQLLALQGGAAPELRRVLQTMLAQIKEMRQWPKFAPPQTLQKNTAVPLRMVIKNDAVLKNERRIKIQPQKLALRVVDGARPAITLSNQMVRRGTVAHAFRIPVKTLSRVAEQIRPANGNRFRVAPRTLSRMAENISPRAFGQQHVARQGHVTPRQARFSALAVVTRLPAALARLSVVVAGQPRNMVPVQAPVQAPAQPPVQAPVARQPATLSRAMAQNGWNAERVARTPVAPQTQQHAGMEKAQPTQQNSARAQQSQADAPAKTTAPVIQTLRTDISPQQQRQTQQTQTSVPPVGMPNIAQQAQAQQATVPPAAHTPAQQHAQQRQTSVPHVGRTDAPPPNTHAHATHAHTDGQKTRTPIVEQYRQAAQDFGERVVRGVQEIKTQVKQHVDGAVKSTLQNISHMAAQAMPHVETFTNKVNSTVNAAYKVAANTVCAISCALKIKCAFCERPASKANMNMMNSLKGLQR